MLSPASYPPEGTAPSGTTAAISFMSIDFIKLGPVIITGVVRQLTGMQHDCSLSTPEKEGY